MTTCPTCGRRVVQVGDDGRPKIRTKILILGDRDVIVSCRHCGADVRIDLVPGRQLAAEIRPRLVVRRGR